MIDLYAMGSPNVVKIYLALEEMDLPYRVIPVDVFAGQQFDPDFVRLNPSAKVPVIVDSDGPGGRPLTVFESGAILLYLAEKTGRFLPADPVARSETHQWLMVQMTQLGPMFGQYVHFMRFAPPGNEYGLSRYATQVRRVLDVLEQRLGASPWLGGADYSIADIATFPWARNIGTLMGAEVAAAYPRIADFVARITARPAGQRAIAQTDAVRARTTQFDKAGADDLDKLFARGAYAKA